MSFEPGVLSHPLCVLCGLNLLPCPGHGWEPQASALLPGKAACVPGRASAEPTAPGFRGSDAAHTGV